MGDDFMNTIKTDHTEIEQMLERIDFYGELADREGMKRDFMRMLDRRDACAKQKVHRRVIRPATIVAAMVLITLISGMAVFADNIEGLLMQFGFTGGIVNKVEQLDGYDPDTPYVTIIYGSQNSSDRESVYHRFTYNSYDEAKEILNFTPLEPEGLDNWVLVSVKGFTDGEEILPHFVELMYEDLNTKGSSSEIRVESTDGISIEESELPRNSGMLVYQDFVGEGASSSTNTTHDIQIVMINGIEAALIGPQPYQSKQPYTLSWMQDGMKIDLCPMGCTYDELIEFAESLIAQAGSR